MYVSQRGGRAAYKEGGRVACVGMKCEVVICCKTPEFGDPEYIHMGISKKVIGSPKMVMSLMTK